MKFQALADAEREKQVLEIHIKENILAKEGEQLVATQQQKTEKIKKETELIKVN